jgi:ketosteroid isomerase-like protein
MSKENVQPKEHAMSGQPVSPDIKAFIDQGFSCWNSGDIDLMADSYADDAEVDTTTALPDGRRYKGREEFERYFQEQWDAWAGLRMEPVDIAAVSGGRHVVEVRMAGTGRSSGIEIDPANGVDLHDARAGRKGRSGSDVPEQGRCPRSRRAVGVGDVAGER